MARRYKIKYNNIVWQIMQEIYMSRLPVGQGGGKDSKPKTKPVF